MRKAKGLWRRKEKCFYMTVFQSKEIEEKKKKKKSFKEILKKHLNFQ